MKIPFSAGNAAFYKFRVILEIHGEKRLRCPVLPDPPADKFPLFRGRKQLRNGIIAHGHIMEIPDKVGTHLDQLVVVFLRCNGIIIRAGIAGGNTVRKLMLVQDFHGSHYFPIYTFAAPAVGGIFKSLQRNRGDEIAHAQHFLRKSIVDQCAVCEGKEYAIIVFFAKADQI